MASDRYTPDDELLTEAVVQRCRDALQHQRAMIRFASYGPITTAEHQLPADLVYLVRSVLNTVRPRRRVVYFRGERREHDHPHPKKAPAEALVRQNHTYDTVADVLALGMSTLALWAPADAGVRGRPRKDGPEAPPAVTEEDDLALYGFAYVAARLDDHAPRAHDVRLLRQHGLRKMVANLADRHALTAELCMARCLRAGAALRYLLAVRGWRKFLPLRPTKNPLHAIKPSAMINRRRAGSAKPR